jgi:hypothetical protein
MKNHLFSFLFMCICVSSFGQVDTLKSRTQNNTNGIIFKNTGADSSFTLPTDTFHLKSTWRGLAFKGEYPYYWNGSLWNRFGTLNSVNNGYALLKTNDSTLYWDSAAAYVTSLRRKDSSTIGNPNGYQTRTTVKNIFTVTNLGFGTATYNSSTGIYNIPKDQRTGDYLNLGKTYVKERPLVYGTTFLFGGNSWSTESFTLGTPWPTQVCNYYGKTKAIVGTVGDDLSWWVKRNWTNANSTGTDSIMFNDIQWIPLLGAATTGNPTGSTYYSDGYNPTGTLNYIYGSFRSFFANYYRKRTGFSVASLADPNFRDATASDSLGTSSATGSIGLGSFQFDKPAGETGIFIGTYIADGVRKHQGTVTVTVGGVTRYSRNLDSLNAANKANTLSIAAGLTYEVIYIRDLPDSLATVVVTAIGDSTAFDYIDFPYSPEQAFKPLYINNFGYGAAGAFAAISDGFTDSANLKLQDAVNDFHGYPIFIQNTNNWYTPAIHNFLSHLSAAGNDSIATAYIRNLIPVQTAPVYNAPASGAGGGSGTPPGSNKEVIYNNSGSFGTKSGFEYDASTDKLTVPGGTYMQRIFGAGRFGDGSSFMEVIPSGQIVMTPTGTSMGSFHSTGMTLNIGTGYATPNASALLDMQSTAQGFLPPRMTTSQRNAISSPATGLIVFCTDCTAIDASTGVTQTYNGTTWKSHW